MWNLDLGIKKAFEWGTSETPRKSTLNVKKSRFSSLEFIYNCSESLLNFTCDHVRNLFRSQFFFLTEADNMKDHPQSGDDEIKIQLLFDILTNQNTRKSQISFSNLHF